jgi:hypothetical protein
MSQQALQELLNQSEPLRVSAQELLNLMDQMEHHGEVVANPLFHSALKRFFEYTASFTACTQYAITEHLSNQ